MLSHGGTSSSEGEGLISSGYGVGMGRKHCYTYCTDPDDSAPGLFVGHDVFRFGIVAPTFNDVVESLTSTSIR